MNSARASDLGVPFSGTPGPLNAITDVEGVEVGHSTLNVGEGPLRVGKGPIRTGVTAILPRGRNDGRHVFGGSFALNGGGEMTGLAWLEECGFLKGPALITNTHSVGVVRDATIQWMLKNGSNFDFAMPVVGETYDGRLNDINGHHIKPEHAWEALDTARGGPVAEGNVGGGTGMMSYEFKSGIGTSSRCLADLEGGYTVGVLVQSNYGFRSQLRIGGIPVGKELTEDLPYYTIKDWRPANARYLDREKTQLFLDRETKGDRDGSIIIVVATDAPLLPHQLKRLVKRPSLAIGRLGGVATEASGDIFVAFSTANAQACGPVANNADPPSKVAGPTKVDLIPNASLTPLFEATIDATEEAIVNSMVAAETCVGIDGLCVSALPKNQLRELLARHNLLANPER